MQVACPRFLVQAINKTPDPFSFDIGLHNAEMCRRESHGGRNFRWIRTKVQGALNSSPETYQDEKKRSSSSVVLSTAVPVPEIGGG